MSRIHTTAIWLVLVLFVAVPVGAAATSPLLAWREPIYIVAGMAGVLALAILLVQPLLSIGMLPGISAARSRRLHRFVGAALVLLVLIHVGGLWITSPPDVIDALLFRSPTPFSYWGVIAMWALLVAAVLAVWRSRLRFHVHTWRLVHRILVTVVVVTTVAHALLIEGTMESLSKWALCSLVVVAIVVVLIRSTKARTAR